MTALPKLTDEQWDDLRQRFPSTQHPTGHIKVGGLLFSRPQIDALRAAGLWCEHDDLSCNDEGVRCAIRDAKERIDPDFEMPDPAVPSLEDVREALFKHRHEDTDPCADRGVEWPCGIASALWPADPGTAPAERFTTGHSHRIVYIYDNSGGRSKVIDYFGFDTYGKDGAQKAADACIAILRRKHSELPAGVRDGRAAKLLRGDA